MALIYCTECGKQISDKAAACPNCGNPIRSVSISARPQYSYTTQAHANIYAASQYAEKLATKEQTSGIIWLVIAIFQFVIGIAGAWFVLIIAVLNALAALGSFQKAKKVRNPYPGMVEEYEKQLIGFILSFVYNIIFGGVIGVAGNIFDLCTRNYVLTNRVIFEDMAEENVRKSEVSAGVPNNIRLTIQYSCALGAQTTVQYAIDGRTVKCLLSQNTPATFYLTQGIHTVSFRYNARDYCFRFNLKENCTMLFLGTVTEIKMSKII